MQKRRETLLGYTTNTNKPNTHYMNNEIILQQQTANIIQYAPTGFTSLVKLFEHAGNNNDEADNLAKKEVWHLANLVINNNDLQTIHPASLMMELKKVPLMGLTLDPSLKLMQLIIHDKGKGIVALEATGRGKAVQAISQEIIKNVSTKVIMLGDRVDRLPNGALDVTPSFTPNAVVIGGVITLYYDNNRVESFVYDQSHINNWQKRSAARFRGTANKNYTSYNGGMEPGFMETKMLKHRLDKIGINPMPNAYKRVPREVIEKISGGDAPVIVQ